MTEDTQVTGHDIVVDTRCYPMVAVHKTLYALSNLTDYELRCVGSDRVEVRLYPKAADILALETSFRQTLADVTIQVQINEETAAIRNALVTAALAESLRPRGQPR